MAKLLLIVLLFGAFADSLASRRSQPPLLIDSAPAPTSAATLDATN
jgi:hypothetical protein